MNSGIIPNKESKYLFVLSLFSFLELFCSGLVTLFITADQKKASIFGFSGLRLLEVGGIWLLAIIVLAAGITARRNNISLNSVWLLNKPKVLRRTGYVISFALIVWGWMALVNPPELFGKYIYIFERIQPLSIALGACLAQFWLFFLYARGRALGKSVIQEYYRPPLIFTVVLIGLGIFMASTQFGLLASLKMSSVPGIPLFVPQLYFLLLLVGLWIAFIPAQAPDQPLLKIARRYWLLPILIFLVAVLAWGLTPLPLQHFSLKPAAPSYQPFPFSDARDVDLGGISILRGFGIHFYGYTDKPLDMVFMAIMHFFAGSNYVVMTWLQILVLAFIPVVLFFFGKKFHSTVFGVFLALVLIFRQRNAIVLASSFFSVNPKLFMTEELTLLAVVLFAYLVFRWMRERKIWLALLSGGCIGAASLLRLNPLFLFPAVAGLSIPAFWGLGKKFIFKHLSAYTLAFLALLIPWLISGVNPQGTPWILVKLFDVIHMRYENINPSAQRYMVSGLPGIGMLAINLEGNLLPILPNSPIQYQATDDPARSLFSQASSGAQVTSDPNSEGIVYRFLYHTFHNFSTSVMALPNTLIFDDLNHLNWNVLSTNSVNWHGDLPLSEILLIFLNLLLVAVGLGYSWIHYRWVGMLPLTIFIAYSLSLGAAMSSGGRYLVPMDWIMYFYYGLAIIAIFQFVHKVLTGKGQSVSVIHNQDSAQGTSSDRWKLGFSLAAVIFLASLIPIANFVMPALTASARNRPDVKAVSQSISEQAVPGSSIVYGEILYPYYENSMLTFDFITPSGDTNYAINRTLGSKPELSSGENVFMSLRNDSQGKPQVESIYSWQGAQPVLIWSHQP
jgi:hypothetical protein